MQKFHDRFSLLVDLMNWKAVYGIGTVLCSLLYAPAAVAQKEPGVPLIYFNGGINIGPLYGIHGSLSAIIRKHHELSVGYENYFKEARNFPPDFVCGFCIHGLVEEWIQGMSIHYGYVLYPRIGGGRVRSVLRAGVLVGRQSIPDHFQPVANPGRGDNYTYQYDRPATVALLIRPTVDMALGRVVGISFGPYGIFSEDFRGGGLSIGVLVESVGRIKAWPRFNKRSKKAMESGG